MALTSSLNCLSCRNPYQAPHSLMPTPFSSTEKPFFCTPPLKKRFTAKNVTKNAKKHPKKDVKSDLSENFQSPSPAAHKILISTSLEIIHRPKFAQNICFAATICRVGHANKTKGRAKSKKGSPEWGRFCFCRCVLLPSVSSVYFFLPFSSVFSALRFFGVICLRETEVQRRRGTTSPDPEKNPEPLRGPLGGFLVGIPREEKAPKSL